ncbi:hypothetical protein DFH28DRAFT_959813 [Melampsora americana]|nr:hypothetical protein DFH28DRAFT_959813 [Melampsora americana]
MTFKNKFKTRSQNHFSKLFVGVFLAACYVSEVYPSPTLNLKNQLLKRQVPSSDPGSSNSTATLAPSTAPGTNPHVSPTGTPPPVVPVAAPPTPPAPVTTPPANPVGSTTSSPPASSPPPPVSAASIPPATPGPVTASPPNPAGPPPPSPPAVPGPVPPTAVVESNPSGASNPTNSSAEKSEGTTQLSPPSGPPPASPPVAGPLIESTPTPNVQQPAPPVVVPAPAQAPATPVPPPATPVAPPAPPVAPPATLVAPPEAPAPPGPPAAPAAPPAPAAPAAPPAPPAAPAAAPEAPVAASEPTASSPTPQTDDSKAPVVSSPVPVLPLPAGTDSGTSSQSNLNVTTAPVNPTSTTPTNSSSDIAPSQQVSTDAELPTNNTTSQDSGASVLPPGADQNSSETSFKLPPAPDQKENNDDFTHLPPAPGQTNPDSTDQTSTSSGFSLPPAPGQTDDLSTNNNQDNFNSSTPLPISKETWAQLNIDDLLIQESSTIDEYARKNKGGNFICGIGENCHAGQLSHPVQSPAWQVLYATQEYNRFMNAMVDSVKYTFSMLQSTSAAMTNDLFENITDSRLVLDLKWVFTDLYRGITYGAVAALVMAWVGISAAIPFVIFGTAFGAGLAAWIQGTPKTVTYQSWTQLSFYIAESEDRIISSITNSFSKSLASPINSDLGIGHVLKAGTFFQPTTTNGIMETMEKNTMKMFQARILSRMLRQNNAFVTIGESDCKGPGPGGAWGGNDVISYCDPKAKLMYNVIRAHKKKSKNSIYGASAIINKYGFSAEYITKTSWACQQKYGRFEHDVYSPNNPEKFPTDLNDDCAINLPVCDTRLPDVRQLLKGQHKSTVVACRKGAGLPI